MTFSVAINESTDVTDIAQLAVFICGVNESLTVMEESLELVPVLDNTTADNIFCAVVTPLDRVGINWSRAVSLATDRAPMTLGKMSGDVAKFRQKLLSAKGGVS